MSQGSTIDYDALAAQHGGTAAVDYDALAAQHGGMPQQAEDRPGFFKRLGQSFGLPTSKAEIDEITKREEALPAWQRAIPHAPGSSPSAARSVANLVLGPGVTTAGDVVKSIGTNAYTGISDYNRQLDDIHQRLQAGQITKEQAITEGQKAVAAGFRALPLLGPTLENASLDVGKGNVSGAAGGMTGIGLQLLGPKALESASPLVRGAAGTAAERLYQSALKPSTAKFAPAAEQVVKTGVDAGIPVSEAGQAKLEGLIDNLNSAISGKIKAGAAAGATIDPADIANRLDTLKAKFAKQALPAEDLQTIEDAKQAFLKAQPNPIPVDEAQAIKQGTYQQLKGKYGQLSSARIESEKALARGIKEELETQFPEIKGLNAQEGQFINLDGALEKAVRRIGNHQLVGIGTPIVAGAVGGTAGGPAGIAAGIMKAVIDDPIVKSRLAISLNKAGRGTIPFGAATLRVSKYGRLLAGPQQSEDER